jgi:hypothetical protein
MSSPLLRSEENYEIKMFLGRGYIDEIQKIISKIDGKEFALKQINLGNYRGDRGEELLNGRRAYLLHRKGNPNVVKSFGSYYDEKTSTFRYSLELMKENLHDLLKRKGNLKFDEFSSIFKDITTGNQEVQNLYFLNLNI